MKEKYLIKDQMKSFFFHEKVDLGSGYSYKTKITLDKQDNTTTKGEGEYILSPVCTSF